MLQAQFELVLLNFDFIRWRSICCWFLNHSRGTVCAFFHFLTYTQGYENAVNNVYTTLDLLEEKYAATPFIYGNTPTLLGILEHNHKVYVVVDGLRY